ncbi:hypothetical protein [Pseudoalteromonas sp. S2755]|uniref:hypothetical protein n=1 Tax=Pseudoalteromonas sp. S2755 TaxID=2066523 RepID=UPI001486C566|nr:hypothetical protein [Pseudoalteromonas sp. S2755]
MGLTVLLFHSMIGAIYHIPEQTIIFIAVSNLLYGWYSFSLAIQKSRSIKRLQLLVFGNLFWAFVCVGVVVQYFNVASLIGIAFIVCEAMFVIMLAYFEWNYRYELVSKDGSA